MREYLAASAALRGKPRRVILGRRRAPQPRENFLGPNAAVVMNARRGIFGGMTVSRGGPGELSIDGLADMSRENWRGGL